MVFMFHNPLEELRSIQEKKGERICNEFGKSSETKQTIENDTTQNKTREQKERK